MRKIATFGALMAATMSMFTACGGSDGDRQGLIEDRLRVGNTQEQAECFADAVLEEFGEDPAADGQLEEGEADILLGLVFDCVGGADE